MRKMYTLSHSIDLLKKIDNNGNIFSSEEHTFVSMRDYYEALRPMARAFIKNPAPDFTELGRGDLNLSAFLKFVVDSKFRGWITFELDIPSLTAYKSARQSLDYFQKVCNHH